jgi:hypothetical protein
MLPYIVIFVFTAVLALLQFGNRKKVSPYLFGAYMLSLGTFVGVSDMLGGYDRYIYCEAFTANADRFANGEGIMNETFVMLFLKEPAYGLINTLIGMYTPNRYIFILVYTLLLYTVYAICFYRYTDYPFFALLVFLGLMFFFTFTYLRQVLAAGIVWLGLPYYTKRKLWQYMMVIALAAMTHNSAAIMAVLYFLPLRKWQFEKIVVVMLILLGLGLIGIGSMFTFAGNLTGIENVSKHASAAEIGFRYEYVVESFLFLYIMYQNYKIVKRDKETLSYLNLYLMFCGILLLFCKSGDGGRIAWYGIMGIIIMLTRFCKGMKGIQLRAFLTVMFFALFMRIVLAWGILIDPYKTFFTDGVREGDWINEQYEYDHNYERDKFYNL